MQCPTCQTVLDDSQRFCPSCGTPLVSPAAAAASADAPDPMLGQVLGGKYKVIRLLGEGGMGAVYEGEQQLGTTVRKVAVKTLHTHLSRDPKVKARFEREVGTIAELEHPNTIQVFDFGSTPEGILYIVMEFLHGKSLADTLEKQGAMAPERTIDIFTQICGSLEEAHRRGIIHRDLKPDNVVLVERAGKKDFVKVLDFGIAKRASEEDKNEQKLTQQGMVLGTPPYMSPEQFTGQPIDARSDIYSLGVMAYEMLTGKLPFKANTAFEWANQHMTQPPIPIESMAEGMRAPPAMRAAILRALAKVPGDRFQSVADFAAALAGKGAAEATGATAAPARAKTEMGAPLDVAAAFGATPLAIGGATPPPYTPAGGNVSFPTPAAIPQPPPRGGSSGGGGSKTPLLLAAGAIGLLSVGAIVFAMKGGSHAAPVVFDNSNQPAPETSIAPAASAETPAPSPSAAPAAGDIPALVGAGPGGGGAHGGAGPSPHPGPGPGPAPGPAPSKGGGAAGGGATPTPTAPAPAPAPAAPGYDGPECQRARRLKAMGQVRAAQAWTLACEAKGGNPN